MAYAVVENGVQNIWSSVGIARKRGVAEGRWSAIAEPEKNYQCQAFSPLKVMFHVSLRQDQRDSPEFPICHNGCGSLPFSFLLSPKYLSRALRANSCPPMPKASASANIKAPKTIEKAEITVCLAKPSS